MNDTNKLNLGCGQNHFPGYANIDKYDYFSPDITWDLETFSWPWEDNSIEEIVFNHSLGQLGSTQDIYIEIMKELYRILKPGALVKIVAPHPRHDDFMNDPTLRRSVTPESLTLLSKRINQAYLENKTTTTPLGLQHNVDFEIVSVDNALDEPWASKFTNGVIDSNALMQASRKYNNVIKEIRIELKAIK